MTWLLGLAAVATYTLGAFLVALFGDWVDRRYDARMSRRYLTRPKP